MLLAYVFLSIHNSALKLQLILFQLQLGLIQECLAENVKMHHLWKSGLYQTQYTHKKK